jgi:hypothetical protein
MTPARRRRAAAWNLEARDPEPVRAGLLGDLGAEGVVDPEQHGGAGALEEILDRGRRLHRSRVGKFPPPLQSASLASRR